MKMKARSRTTGETQERATPEYVFRDLGINPHEFTRVAFPKPRQVDINASNYWSEEKREIVKEYSKCMGKLIYFRASGVPFLPV